MKSWTNFSWTLINILIVDSAEYTHTYLHYVCVQHRAINFCWHFFPCSFLALLSLCSVTRIYYSFDRSSPFKQTILDSDMKEDKRQENEEFWYLCSYKKFCHTCSPGSISAKQRGFVYYMHFYCVPYINLVLLIDIKGIWSREKVELLAVTKCNHDKPDKTFAQHSHHCKPSRKCVRIPFDVIIVVRNVCLQGKLPRPIAKASKK